jgi:PKD repeat protein
MYNVVVVPKAGQTEPHCTLHSSPAARVNTAVQFAVESIVGSQPITYAWDFGDGSTLTSSARHTYAAPGRYGVVLTVRNAHGQSSCALVQIVHHALTAQPAVASSSIVHNGGYAFNVNPDNHTVTAINEKTLT